MGATKRASSGGGVSSHTLLTNRDAANQHPASSLAPDTSNFDKILSAADSTVQKALETIDEHTHAHDDTTGITATNHHDNSNDPTADEKAALAGTDGSPSVSNKYVTDTDSRLTDARVPTAHHTTHEVGGTDEVTITHAQTTGQTATDHHDNSNDPTTDEKAALAGTGTPSASNKYVTADELSKYATIVNGIKNPELLSLSYDPSTRQLTVVNTGATVSVNGTVVTPENEVTTAHSNTTGLIFFYYEEGNTKLTVSEGTHWSILNHAMAHFEYFNASLTDAIGQYEKHPNIFSALEHYTEHFFHGTKFLGGCVLSDYTLQPVSPTDADNQFSVTTGIYADEDIIHDMIALSSGGPYTIMYRQGATDWYWNKVSTLPFLSATYAQYNLYSGGVWSLSEITNNEYFNLWVIGIYNARGIIDIFVVTGQNKYSTLAGASAETYQTSIDWGTAPFQEFCPLYRITMRGGAAYTSTGQVRIAAIESLRYAKGGSVAVNGTPASHQLLSDRDAIGSHPASAISTDTTNFNGKLSIADDTVQKALETLDDAAPLAHAASHTNGTDDIQDATAAQKGLATAAQITKLDGIEAGAEVNNISDVNAIDLTDGGGTTLHTHAHADTTGKTATDHHDNSNDPTSDQKAALAGTSGTPSATNKYVTNDDSRNTDARTPTAHKDTHKSGGTDAFTSSDLLEAVVKRLQTSTGPTTLTLGAISDGQYLKRSGATVVGDTPSAGGGNCYIEVGSYTGDGTTGQTINLVDSALDIKYIIIPDGRPTSEISYNIRIKADDSWGDYAIYYGSGGGSSQDSRINTVGTGSFSVDDDGSDQHPNKNGVTYTYIAIGTH